MAKKKNTPQVTAKVRGQSLVFKAPTFKQYVRFYEKLSRREISVARRELLSNCITSHSGEEFRALINKAPAALSPLSKGVEDLAHGEVFYTVTEEFQVLVKSGEEEFILDCPDINTWEDSERALSNSNNRRIEEAKKFLVILAGDQGAEFDSLLTAHPGCIHGIYGAVSELAGAEVDVVVKKG